MTLALPDDATAGAELAAEYAAARRREGRVMAILRPFVHVELDEPCDGDIRVRSEDLVAVLP